jgi:hypothetical protein
MPEETTCDNEPVSVHKGIVFLPDMVNDLPPIHSGLMVSIEDKGIVSSSILFFLVSNTLNTLIVGDTMLNTEKMVSTATIIPTPTFIGYPFVTGSRTVMLVRYNNCQPLPEMYTTSIDKPMNRTIVKMICVQVNEAGLLTVTPGTISFETHTLLHFDGWREGWLLLPVGTKSVLRR